LIRVRTAPRCAPALRRSRTPAGAT
jgi:hypothetical protein